MKPFGELLMIIGIKQQRRALMVALLLASAVMTGYFLNRAFLQQVDSSSLYPVWVALCGAVLSTLKDGGRRMPPGEGGPVAPEGRN